MTQFYWRNSHFFWTLNVWEIGLSCRVKQELHFDKLLQSAQTEKPRFNILSMIRISMIGGNVDRASLLSNDHISRVVLAQTATISAITGHEHTRLFNSHEKNIQWAAETVERGTKVWVVRFNNYVLQEELCDKVYQWSEVSPGRVLVHPSNVSCQISVRSLTHILSEAKTRRGQRGRMKRSKVRTAGARCKIWPCWLHIAL